MNTWHNRPITILGLGHSGQEAALYLAKRGAKVTLSEIRPLDAHEEQIAHELSGFGIQIESNGHSQASLESAELIIASPALRPDSEVIKRCLSLGKQVVSDIEIAFREASVPIIAITGSSGKSTTAALISFMLERNGLRAPVCGSYGWPALAALAMHPNYLVTAVSTRQTFYCDKFAPHIGVWLNMSVAGAEADAEIDWLSSLDDVFVAHAAMFVRQSASDYAVLNMHDPIVAASRPRSEVFPFDAHSELTESIQGAFIKREFLSYRYHGATHILAARSELAVLGHHHIEDMLAAVSVGAILGLSAPQIARSLKEFRGLEHRLEYVDTVSQMRCYNDALATTGTRATLALESLGNKTVLITGGVDSEAELDEFVRSVVNHTTAVILLGGANQRFAEALIQGGVQNIYAAGSMEEAVDLGLKVNRGSLLLAPAGKTFDMFKDAEELGHVFKNIVRSRCKKITDAPS